MSRWRDGLRDRPTYDLVYRIVVGVVGLAVLGLGILAIPYRGRGGGRSSSSDWASWRPNSNGHRLLRYTKERYDRVMEWFGEQGLWVKVLGVVLTGAVVIATLWLFGALSFAAGLFGIEQPWLKSPIGLGS